jgi:hypothetical protein
MSFESEISSEWLQADRPIISKMLRLKRARWVCFMAVACHKIMTVLIGEVHFGGDI